MAATSRGDDMSEGELHGLALWKAALLGLVQGVGEFLPISSSGHLVLLSWFMRSSYQGLAFDVALHVGTLVALLAYFWRDWVRLISAGLTKGTKTNDGRLFWYLVAASVPAGLFGVLAGDEVENALRDPLIIGVMLIAMGAALYAADRYGRRTKPVEKTTLADAMVIGFMQVIALVPGTSRSGATMTGGMLRGQTREAAARFSFLLSAPAIFGAAALELPKLAHSGMQGPVLVGMIVAAVSGMMAIGFLLRFLRTNGFGIFFVYRLVLGLSVIALRLVRGA